MKLRTSLAAASLFLATLLAVGFWSSPASAALNIYEDFDYATGALQGKQYHPTDPLYIWQRAGGGNPPAQINVVSGSLTGPPELQPTTVPNTTSIKVTGGTVGQTNRLWLGSAYSPTSGNTTTVYYSFLLNVDELTGSNNVAGGHFFSLNNTGNAEQPGNPTVMPGRVQAHIDPNDATKFSLAVLNNRTLTSNVSNVAVDDPAWYNGLSVDQTYLIVGAVDINNVGGGNPFTATNARLWVDPNPGFFGNLAAPSADRIDTATTGVSGWVTAGAHSVLVRQGATPHLFMDELRVAGSWADVTPPTIPFIYWDLNGTTAGAGAAPTGFWDSGSLNWTTSTNGTAATQAWITNGKAVFSAGSDATGTYDVTLSGAQTVASLTFKDGAVKLLGDDLILSAAGAIDVNASLTATIASKVTGTPVGLTKGSAGRLVLTNNANSYTGPTTISAGTLQLGDGLTPDGALPTSSAIITNGTFAVSQTDDVTQGVEFSGGPITGTGGLTQAGSAVLTLNAENTFSGTTHTGAGTLRLTHSLALKNSILNLDGTDTGIVEFTVTSATVGALAGSDDYVLQNTTAQALALTFGNGTGTHTGNLSGAGSLTKNGTGVQRINGINNSYTGGTTVTAGTLQFGKKFSMSDTGSVSVQSGATLAVNAGGTDEWTADDFPTVGGTIGGLINGEGGRDIEDQITWLPGSVMGIDTTNAGGSLSYGGVIGDFRTTGDLTTNNVGFTKRGTGTLTLTGNNTFSGQLSTAASGGTLVLTGTQLSAGTSMPMSIPIVSVGTSSNIELAASDRLPAGSVITTQSLGRFRLNNNNQTVRSLSGTHGVVEVGTGILTIDDQAGDNYTYGSAGGGVIDTLDGGTVKKIGAGTLTLAGDSRPGTNVVNGFKGHFIMEAGTLKLSDQFALGSTGNTGRLTVKGGVLSRTNTPTSNYTYAISNVDLHVFSYDLGSDQPDRTSQFNPSTVTTLKEDNVEIEITNTPTGLGRFAFQGNIRNNDPFFEPSAPDRSITKTGNGELRFVAATSYRGSTTIEEGILSVTAAGTLGDYVQATTGTLNLKGGTLAVAGTVLDPRTAPIKNPVNVDGHSTVQEFSGAALASVVLEFNNDTIEGTSGSLTVANKNTAASIPTVFQPTFTGNGFDFDLPIVLSNSVQVGNASGIKSNQLQGGNASLTQTFSGPISGGGSVRRINAGGETVLSGTNTYSGGTTVVDGKLTAGGTSAFGTGNVTVNGGELEILTTVSNAIANSATLSVMSAGQVLLGAGVNEVIALLSLNDGSGPVQFTSGTYGCSTCGADNTDLANPDDYFSGLGMLTIVPFVPGVPGDYNENDVVDAADYVMWRKKRNPDPDAPALANDDTPGVLPGDYDRWKMHFGEVPDEGSGGGGNIPEPGTIALALFAGLGLMGYSTRRR